MRKERLKKPEFSTKIIPMWFSDIIQDLYNRNWNKNVKPTRVDYVLRIPGEKKSMNKLAGLLCAMKSNVPITWFFVFLFLCGSVSDSLWIHR